LFDQHAERPAFERTIGGPAGLEEQLALCGHESPDRSVMAFLSSRPLEVATHTRCSTAGAGYRNFR
jgi:hypothetical protein